LNQSVLAVHKRESHTFSKTECAGIHLLEGQGVDGDAHCGRTVKHRSRVAQDPTQPNLRQVHLMHAELFAELQGRGFHVTPGSLGENITTCGVALLALPVGTRLHVGAEAVIELTGLRNPCVQIEKFQPGLLAAVLDRGPRGELVRKAGVMGVVLAGGTIRPADKIAVLLPAGEHRPLERV